MKYFVCWFTHIYFSGSSIIHFNLLLFRMSQREAVIQIHSAGKTNPVSVEIVLDSSLCVYVCWSIFCVWAILEKEDTLQLMIVPKLWRSLLSENESKVSREPLMPEWRTLEATWAHNPKVVTLKNRHWK